LAPLLGLGVSPAVTHRGMRARGPAARSGPWLFHPVRTGQGRGTMGQRPGQEITEAVVLPGRANLGEDP
jgi:hypothetical protein